MKRIFLPALFCCLFMGCAPFEANQTAVLRASNFVQDCGPMTEEACRTLYWVNYYRIINWLEPLETNTQCTAGAVFHARDMVQFNYFSHDGRNETWEQRYARFQVQGQVGENIAQGPSAQQAVIDWMNSPDHRDNILDPAFRSGGIGVFEDVYVNCFSSDLAD